MRYHIWTVGCQMNKADSERMADALEGLGLTFTGEKEEADVIIINSCSVRGSAEQKVMGRMSALKPLKKQSPNLIVALAGCMVGSDVAPLREKLPFVDLFLKPLEIDPLLKLVVERRSAAASVWQPPIRRDLLGFEEAEAVEVCVREGGESSSLENRKLAPSRWVPIIYGCDNFCSYCIVPFRRGRERSRPPKEIVDEICRVVDEGAREVTLLGQNVDSYGHDLPGHTDLADLLHATHEIDGVERIRFLTSHPKDMTHKLIDAVAELPKVCECINLPVQSGDDAILRAMKRGYTVDDYRYLARRIRGTIPGVTLTTDLIVGFPGETNEQFENSYRLLEELRFEQVHVAMYSPRPGTAAFRLGDDVPAEEKKDRLQKVEALQERIAVQNARALLGATVQILVEGEHKGKWQGRTRANKPVFFESDRDWLGKLAQIRIDQSSPWSAQGRVLGEEPVKHL